MRKSMLLPGLLLVANGMFAQQKLIWSEEFNGKQLNKENWTVQTGYGDGNNGWGNNEWQNYTGDNISFHHGNLVIMAKKIATGQKRGDYTSARITSKGKQQFLYGRIEARIKLPKGKGTWPAFWMLGTEGRWPACGETDILEYVGFDPETAHGATHTPSSFGATVNKGLQKISGLEDDYHVFGVNWLKDKIEFYVDDPAKPYYTYNPKEKNAETWPFDKPQYLLLNFAVGGNWGGTQGVDDTIFPQKMLVDWIRVYDLNDKK